MAVNRLPDPNGGIQPSTLTTTGDILYASSAQVAARLAIGSTNQALGVTGGVPAYQASSKSTLTTTGDIIYASAANTPARLGIGSSAQVLTVASGVPSWATPASGLTFIRRSTFSAVANTGTTFDGIFSATYSSYLVIIENFYAVTNADDMLVTARIGATTMTTAYNSASIVTNNVTTSIVTVLNTGGSNFLLADFSGSAAEPTRGQLSIPLAGVAAGMVMNGDLSNTTSSRYYNFNGSLYPANTYTGLQFSSASSNISGTISVYGLALS